MTSLTAYQLEQELVQTIDRNQITVIAGATGCGKTTQVPQFVLGGVHKNRKIKNGEFERIRDTLGNA